MLNFFLIVKDKYCENVFFGKMELGYFYYINDIFFIFRMFKR